MANKHDDAQGWKRGNGAYSKDYKVNPVVYVTKKDSAESTIMDNGERKAGFAAKLDKK